MAAGSGSSWRLAAAVAAAAVQPRRSSLPEQPALVLALVPRKQQRRHLGRPVGSSVRKLRAAVQVDQVNDGGWRLPGVWAEELCPIGRALAAGKARGRGHGAPCGLPPAGVPACPRRCCPLCACFIPPWTRRQPRSVSLSESHSRQSRLQQQDGAPALPPGRRGGGEASAGPLAGALALIGVMPAAARLPAPRRCPAAPSCRSPAAGQRREGRHALQFHWHAAPGLPPPPPAPAPPCSPCHSWGPRPAPDRAAPCPCKPARLPPPLPPCRLPPLAAGLLSTPVSALHALQLLDYEEADEEATAAEAAKEGAQVRPAAGAGVRERRPAGSRQQPRMRPGAGGLAGAAGTAAAARLLAHRGAHAKAVSGAQHLQPTAPRSRPLRRRPLLFTRVAARNLRLWCRR